MTQLTFADAAPRVATDDERRRAAAEAVALAGRLVDSPDEAVAAEIDRLEAELLAYVRALGVGAEFQAADFTRHLSEVGRAPDPALIDARRSGGLFVRLSRAGAIKAVGYRVNAGCRATGYHATPRTVWRVERV